MAAACPSRCHEFTVMSARPKVSHLDVVGKSNPDAPSRSPCLLWTQPCGVGGRGWEQVLRCLRCGMLGGVG